MQCKTFSWFFTVFFNEDLFLTNDNTFSPDLIGDAHIRLVMHFMVNWVLTAWLLHLIKYQYSNIYGLWLCIGSQKLLSIFEEYIGVFFSIGDKEGMDSNLSEGTVETLLTLSPSEPSVEVLASKL